MFIPISFIVLILIVASSVFIASKVYKGLRKDNNNYAGLWAVLSFILSFAVLAAGIFFLIINNIRIER